jgi:hypothetical protein
MVRSSSVIKSLVFHTALVGSFVVSFPFLSRDFSPEQPILTVEVVNRAPETNLDEGVEAKVEPSAPEKDTEEPEVEQQETPPPAPPPAPPKVAETAEAVPVPSENAEPVEAPKPKPENVQAPPRRPTEKSPDDKKIQQAQLTSKLQDLTEREEVRREKEEKEKKKKAAEEKVKDLLSEKKEEGEEVDQLVGQALNTPPKKSSVLSVSDLDVLRNALGSCWNPPAGASGADALIVDIIVRLNEGGEVENVDIVDKARMNSDAAFRAAARSASRAVIACSPLPLPSDKYELWKELQFEFNPRFITRR